MPGEMKACVRVFVTNKGVSPCAGLMLVVLVVLLNGWCVEAAGTLRGLEFVEERLIGWLGETHHTETPSTMMHRISDEEKERGAWVEQLSWRPRA